MAKTEVKRNVISKWAKGYKDRDGVIIPKLAQVVYKQEIGKNRKGKTIYDSITKHERIS